MKKNDYPDMIPDEVWDAQQSFYQETDPERKKELEAKYRSISDRYLKDAQKAFVKGENGKFIKSYEPAAL